MAGDDEVNDEIEGFKKKKEMKLEELDGAFKDADTEAQREALQGLGKLSKKHDGDPEKMKDELESDKEEIAKRLGINLNRGGKGRDK